MKHLLTMFATGALLFGATVARAQQKIDCVSTSEKAQQFRDEHKLVEAREQFISCAQAECPMAVRKDCADEMTEMDKRIPSVVVRARDKGGQDLVTVHVTSNGVVLAEQLDGRAIKLNPGVHTFRFEAAGNEPFEQKIVVGEGEQNRPVTAQFGHLEPPITQKRTVPVGAFVFGAVGLVAMGVAPIFYAMGVSQHGTDVTSCGATPTGCASGEIDSIRTKLIIGDSLLLGGGAIALTSVIWTIAHYVSGGHAAVVEAAMRFDVTPLPHGGTIGTTFRW